MTTGTRSTARILVVEDEQETRNLIGLALKHQGYSADFAEDTAEAIRHLHQVGSRFSAILVDLTVQGNLSNLIGEVRRVHPGVPVIGLVEDRASASRGDVNELIEKPITSERLRAAVQACLRDEKSDALAPEAPAHSEMAARPSVWQTEIQPLVRHVAAADVPVLIQGETGVGKEVLARQLHLQSPRAKKAFLKVNCAALPSELIESELFGYERGAFTGAFKTTPGKFEMADGGSILLDEIGDMDFKLQAKLLQVLQDREFIRLGSSEPRRVDVRVLAATHCNLEQAIAERRFREDLYYRLNIITIHIPALRDRKEEILPLAHHFIHKYATAHMPAVEITPYLRDVLESHDWPGNVRELENAIRRLLVLRSSKIVAEDILARARRFNPESAPQRIQTLQTLQTKTNAPVFSRESATPPPKMVPETMVAAAAAGSAQLYIAPVSSYRPARDLRDEDDNGETRDYDAVPAPRSFGLSEPDRRSILDRVDEARREAETEAIMQALNSTLWNRKRAAELLGIDYKALLYKMKKLGIVDRAAKIAI